MSLPLLHAGKSAPGLSAQLDLRFALDKSLTAYRGPTPSFSRASTGTYFNSSGVLTSAAINAPRFDHTYNGTSWVSRGLLVEEQRTNLCNYSEDLANAAWSDKTRMSVTANSGIAPDGNLTADLVYPNTTGAYSFCGIPLGNVLSIGTKYTNSIYLKASGKTWATVVGANGSYSAYFNLASGTIGTVHPQVTASIQNVGNGWYRCSVTTTTVSATGYYYIGVTDADDSSSVTASGTDGVLAWGAQLETGSFATSYIPNLSNGSTTRSADVCQITGSDFSGFWNGTEGTLVSDFDVFGLTNSSGNVGMVWQADDNTLNNRLVQIGYEYSGTPVNGVGIFVASGGSPQANMYQSPIGTNIIGKSSFAYKANDFALSVQGASVSSDTSGLVPSVTQLNIGKRITDTFLNGHIARLRYFNKRLPNATLQLLSDPDPTLNLQFALNKSLTPVAGPAPSFSRASTGTYFNASGVLTSASINTPRFDHVYSGGQWVSRGLLIEEQRTNLCLYSNPYAAALNRWGSSFVTLTPNAVISPDGTQNATSVVGVNTAAYFQIYYYFNQASGTYTQSFFLKSNGANIVSVYDYAGNAPVGWYDLANGTSQAGSYGGVTYSATITNVGNGWYRCTVTNQSATSMPWIHLRPKTAMGGTTDLSGNGVRGFYVYGVQGEAGAFATSLIQTNGSALTRSADVCQITGTSFGWMWNQGEGSVAFEADVIGNNSSNGNQFVFGASLSSSAANNQVALVRNLNNLGGDYGLFVNNAGTPQVLTSRAAGSWTVGSTVKAAAAYKLNDFADVLNGGAAITDTSGTIPTVDQLSVGNFFPGGGPLNGHIAKLIYYPARLTNTKLQQLST